MNSKRTRRQSWSPRTLGRRLGLPLVLLAVGLVPFACAESAEHTTRDDAETATDGGALSDAADNADASALDASPDRGAPPCSASGFCYEAMPLERPLMAISATGANDVWAAGGDSIFRWDGNAWSVAHQVRQATPDSNLQFLFGVWAASSDDVWALARHPDSLPDGYRLFFVHYAKRGGAVPDFREFETSLFFDDPTYFRYPASYWVPPASDVVWFVNDLNVRRFREGTNGTMDVEDLTPVSPPPGSDLDTTPTYGNWRTVWGFGPNDVYVGGQCLHGGDCTDHPQAALARWDGTSWSFVTLPAQGIVTGMIGESGSGPHHLWVRLEDRFLRYPNPGMSIDGRILRLPLTETGDIGAPLFEQTATWSSYCNGFFGSMFDAGTGWLSNGCLLYRWTKAQLEAAPFSLGAGPVGMLKGIWAATPEDVWIVGQEISKGGSTDPSEGPVVTFPVTGFAAHRRAPSP